MFFFRDPLSAHPHIADIESLSRLADVYQVYYASNYRSAGSILESMHAKLMHTRDAPTNSAPRKSVRAPDALADLGQAVQKQYKATREQAAKKAADQSSASMPN